MAQASITIGTRGSPLALAQAELARAALGAAHPELAGLAAFPLFGYPTDIEPTERWFDPGLDPVEVAMMRDGTIAVPESIGVDSIIDHDKLRRNSHLMY